MSRASRVSLGGGYWLDTLTRKESPLSAEPLAAVLVYVCYNDINSSNASGSIEKPVNHDVTCVV